MSSLEERRNLAEQICDPLNRWYRYPAARGLLRVAGGLPLRPDHITYLHTTLGVLGAALIAFGDRGSWVIAFVLLEVRAILDCYDGILARAKKLSSPRGRAMDEIGDATAFIALVVGMSILIHRTRPELPVALLAVLAVLVIAASAMSGHAHDFYVRHLGGALKDGRDAVAEEIAEKEKLSRSRGGRPPWITRYGLLFDRWQLRLYTSTAPGEDAVANIIARSGTPGMRFLIRLISLLSNDNVFFAMPVAVLLGVPFELQLGALAYAMLMFTVVRVTIWRVLGTRSGA